MMLICWITSTNCLYSQTTIIDATLVPNAKLRDAAKLIEKGKICEERVLLLQQKISMLNERISIKDSIIQLHNDKDTAQARIAATYKAEIDNLVEQRNLAKKEMKHQNTLMKRQKRKTVFAIVGTAAVLTGAYYFIIK